MLLSACLSASQQWKWWCGSRKRKAGSRQWWTDTNDSKQQKVRECLATEEGEGLPPPPLTSALPACDYCYDDHDDHDDHCQLDDDQSKLVGEWAGESEQSTMEKERGRQPATWSLARVTAALMTCRKNRRRPLDRQTQTDTGSADGGRLTELALKHCCPSADERKRRRQVGNRSRTAAAGDSSLSVWSYVRGYSARAGSDWREEQV